MFFHIAYERCLGIQSDYSKEVLENVESVRSLFKDIKAERVDGLLENIKITLGTIRGIARAEAKPTDLNTDVKGIIPLENIVDETADVALETTSEVEEAALETPESVGDINQRRENSNGNIDLKSKLPTQRLSSEAKESTEAKRNIEAKNSADIVTETVGNIAGIGDERGMDEMAVDGVEVKADYHCDSDTDIEERFEDKAVDSMK